MKTSQLERAGNANRTADLTCRITETIASMITEYDVSAEEIFRALDAVRALLPRPTIHGPFGAGIGAGIGQAQAGAFANALRDQQLQQATQPKPTEDEDNG